MSNTPIGFAIIGTGMIAEFHSKAISLVPEARLISAYSRSEDACAAFAKANGCNAARSLEEITNDPAVRAVCITTPSGAHAEAAGPLLKAGKAVLCEKPMDVTLEAVDSILGAA